MTETDVQSATHIRKRYEQGAGLEELALEVGLSRATVRKRLVAAGGTPRKPAPRRKDLDPDALAAAYLAGESVSAIAARLGLDAQTVRGRLEERDIAVRRGPRPNLPEDMSGVCATYNEGATLVSLAKELGVARPTLRAALVGLGVEIRDERMSSTRQPASERRASGVARRAARRSTQGG